MSCKDNKDAFLPVNPKCDNVNLNWPCGCQTKYVRGEEEKPRSCKCKK